VLIFEEKICDIEMTTITIQTNNSYGQKLYQKLKADKNLKKVVLEDNSKPISEIELILPGKQLNVEELLMMLSLASKGKSLSLKDARKKTLSKIAAWRKNK